MEIWNGDIILYREVVTNDVMSIVDIYLDKQLGLTDYKRKDAVITYIGKGGYHNDNKK